MKRILFVCFCASSCTPAKVIRPKHGHHHKPKQTAESVSQTQNLSQEPHVPKVEQPIPSIEHEIIKPSLMTIQDIYKINEKTPLPETISENPFQMDAVKEHHIGPRHIIISQAIVIGMLVVAKIKQEADIYRNMGNLERLIHALK